MFRFRFKEHFITPQEKKKALIKIREEGIKIREEEIKNMNNKQFLYNEKFQWNNHFKGLQQVNIYCFIGQKQSGSLIFNIMKYSESNHYTIFFFANASSSAPEQYTIPYSGCTYGGYFRDLGLNSNNIEVV